MAAWTAALVPLLLGFALRLHYVLQAEPFVDEPTTLLVAEAIARSGVPVLPSGLFYGNDLPFSYVAGGLVFLFGPQLMVLRLFSLAASVLTIGLVYLAGRRFFSPWAGLWAALLLATSPEAIIWGGRARGYALLGLLVLVAVGLFYAGLDTRVRPVAGWRGPGPDALRRLGLLCLVAATFVHPEAGLLLPALVVAAVLLRGWRWWLRADRLVELGLTAAGVAARYWLQIALAQGQIGGFETVTGSRPPLQLAANWLPRLEGVLPFFLDPGRLPWTILALLALSGAVWNRLRKRRSPAGGAVFTLSACLWLVPLEMTLLLGDTYQSVRYLTMLLPMFALLAASGLEWTLASLAKLGRFDRWRAPVAALVSALLLATSLPGAVEAANTPEKGFRSALEYVGARWEAVDRVATVAPAYSQLVLGRSDLFTLGLDYEEFVYRAEDGRLVDRWLASPLIRSAEELAAALDAGGRVWLVVDEGRLRERFEPAFAQMVWDRMDLATKIDGVMVFSSREPSRMVSLYRELVPAPVFGGQVALTGYEIGLSRAGPPDPGRGDVVAYPGQNLPVTLYWQAVAPVIDNYTVFVHLLGPDGQRHAQDDGPPLSGIQPMTHWLVDETLPDRRVLQLPADLPPERYRLVVGLYQLDGGDRLPITTGDGQALGQELTLDYVQVVDVDEPLPEPAVTVGVDLGGDGDQVRLVGYTLESSTAQAGGALTLTLYWQALVPASTDYTVFVHLLDSDNQIRGQGDGPPAGGYYPTSFWDAGEMVVDVRPVAVDDDAAPGSYRLVVGLYHLPSGRRLSTAEGDRVLLEEVQIR